MLLFVLFLSEVIYSLCVTAFDKQKILDQARETNLKFYKRSGIDLAIAHFTEPLQTLGFENEIRYLEIWVAEAKELNLDSYLDELAAIIYDAIEVVHSFPPFQLDVKEYIKTAKVIGSPEALKLRYVGDKKEFKAHRRQFGKMFQDHIEKLLVPKVREVSHDDVMEENMTDALKIRAFVEKHWTRHGKKETTVKPPKSIKIDMKRIEL